MQVNGRFSLCQKKDYDIDNESFTENLSWHHLQTYEKIKPFMAFWNMN